MCFLLCFLNFPLGMHGHFLFFRVYAVSFFFFNVLVSNGGLTMRMSEEKDMRLSSPVRTLKSQLAAEQPSAGECWIPPIKDTLVQGQR